MNKETKRIKTINTEKKLMAARGKGCWGMGKIREREWEIQALGYGMHKSRNKRRRVGNIVGGIVTVLYGDRW